MSVNLMTPHGMLAATECANTHFTIFCQKYNFSRNLSANNASNK